MSVSSPIGAAAGAAALALVLALFAQPGPQSACASAEAPLAVVRNSNESVLALYASAEKIGRSQEEEIFTIIDEVTDYGAMAAAATERACRDLTGEQCSEFRDVFIELLRVSSVKKLGRYRADRFDYLGESVENGEAVVETVAHYKEDRIAVVYHLALEDGRWRIVNYVVDDIDTIRNYRKQFKRLFSSRGFEDVLQRLRERIAEYEKETPR